MIPVVQISLEVLERWLFVYYCVVLWSGLVGLLSIRTMYQKLRTTNTYTRKRSKLRYI